MSESQLSHDASKTDPELPPAERCVRCERTLPETGGRFRITCTYLHGMLLRAAPETQRDAPGRPAKGSAGATREGSRTVMIDTPHGSMQFSSWGTIWTDEMRERADAAVGAGRMPWFCQRCVGRTCSVCGSPLIFAQGSTVLHEDGRTRHHMAIPTTTCCSNPNCERAARSVRDATPE